jgi:hypothetical protein
VLGAPVNKSVELTIQLLNQLTRYFGVFHQGLRVQEIQARIDPESIIRYGRFRMTGDGDNVRTAALIDRDPIARDNSYVKVCAINLFSISHLYRFLAPVRSFARC